MCTNFWINPHNGKLPSRLAPAQCSVPKFTNTSITVKHLLIKIKNINQSKSSLLIWHYVSYLFLFIVIPFVKNILKHLSRMARVSLSRAERSMFLPVRTVSDASERCKCSIKVPFVVWELTVNNNNNNNDILIHFLQRKIFNLQMHRLLVHLVHLDTCIYFCPFFGTRLTVYSYRHYLYKQLKTPGMLCHTVYSIINRLEQINSICTSFS